jgi:ribonuclease HI
MLSSFNEITIFTDGSSRGNPGPGGWGAILLIPNNQFLISNKSSDMQVVELGGMEEHTTNNRMELTAVIKALSFLSTFNSLPSIVIYSDSAYVINGITKWVYGWQKNGWVTATKNPVENQDLWQELFSLTKNFKIDWHRIDGHVGIRGNERCDEIATSFADESNPALYSGTFESYSIKDILDIQQERADPNKFSKRKNKGAKAYSYVSLVDGKIEIHKTWAECEKRVKGKKAKYKKATSEKEESDLVKIFKEDAF